MDDFLQQSLISCGWWTLNRDKILHSEADYWVFVLYTFNQKKNQFIIIKPSELLNRLDKLYGKQKRIHSYIWVTKGNRCWETRGLKKQEQILVAKHKYSNEIRDLSHYLNNWEEIKKRLK